MTANINGEFMGPAHIKDGLVMYWNKDFSEYRVTKINEEKNNKTFDQMKNNIHFWFDDFHKIKIKGIEQPLLSCKLPFTVIAEDADNCTIMAKISEEHKFALRWNMDLLYELEDVLLYYDKKNLPSVEDVDVWVGEKIERKRMFKVTVIGMKKKRSYNPDHVLTYLPAEHEDVILLNEMGVYVDSFEQKTRCNSKVTLYEMTSSKRREANLYTINLKYVNGLRDKTPSTFTMTVDADGYNFKVGRHRIQSVIMLNSEKRPIGFGDNSPDAPWGSEKGCRLEYDLDAATDGTTFSKRITDGEIFVIPKQIDTIEGYDKNGLACTRCRKPKMEFNPKKR